MKMIVVLFTFFLFFSFTFTMFFWNKQKGLKKKSIHHIKNVSKFDLIEISPKDDSYNEYYEPKIIEVLPNEDIL